MLSRPESCGWNPVPTSSSEPMRPRYVSWPVVGSVIRERIFRSVLLPAPLWPIRPTASPCRTPSEMSRSAQNSRTPDPERPTACFHQSPAASMMLRWGAAVPTRYTFDRPSISIAGCATSDHVREAMFHAPEQDEPAEEEHQSRKAGDRE